MVLYIINKKIKMWGKCSSWSTHSHTLSFSRIHFHTPQLTPSTEFNDSAIKGLICREETNAKGVTSSAYTASLFSRPEHLSLVYEINSRGPRTLPWGRPETYVPVITALPINNHPLFLYVKNSIIILRKVPRMPICLSYTNFTTCIQGFLHLTMESHYYISNKSKGAHSSQVMKNNGHLKSQNISRFYKKKTMEKYN